MTDITYYLDYDMAKIYISPTNADLEVDHYGTCMIVIIDKGIVSVCCEFDASNLPTDVIYVDRHAEFSYFHDPNDDMIGEIYVPTTSYDYIKVRCAIAKSDNKYELYLPLDPTNERISTKTKPNCYRIELVMILSHSINKMSHCLEKIGYMVSDISRNEFLPIS